MSRQQKCWPKCTCFFQERWSARVRSGRRASKKTIEETPFFIREKEILYPAAVVGAGLAQPYLFVSGGCQDTWDDTLFAYTPDTSCRTLWIISRWLRIPDTMQTSYKWLLDCGPQGISPRKRSLCVFSTDTNLFPSFLDLLLAEFIHVEPKIMGGQAHWLKIWSLDQQDGSADKFAMKSDNLISSLELTCGRRGLVLWPLCVFCHVPVP